MLVDGASCGVWSESSGFLLTKLLLGLLLALSAGLDWLELDPEATLSGMPVTTVISFSVVLGFVGFTDEFVSFETVVTA